MNYATALCKKFREILSGDFYILVSKCREIEEEVRARWVHTTAFPKTTKGNLAEIRCWKGEVGEVECGILHYVYVFFMSCA
jgi:hypothetical protein